MGIEKIKQCPECGSANIVYNKNLNQIICKDCGLIYEPYASVIDKIKNIAKTTVSVGVGMVKKVARKKGNKAKKKSKTKKKKTKKKIAKKKAKKKPKTKKKRAKKTRFFKIFKKKRWNMNLRKI